MSAFTMLLLLMNLFTVNQEAAIFQRLEDQYESAHFGKYGIMQFDLRKRTFHMYYGDKKIIADAYAMVKNKKVMLTSKMYAHSRYRRFNIKDNFGVGNKHVITYSTEGYPQMVQVFYTYPGEEFFLQKYTLTGRR
ncbi:MAG: hypothetical protein ACOH2A_05735 [Sphingobacteriaceae bacterium]